MSISATYLLGHVARSKLSKEAAKGDHNLRRLVGHANLLDSIMLDLAEAEREQEAWLEETVSHNNKAQARVQTSSPSKNIKWVDRILEEDSDLEIPDASDDSESESDEEETEEQLASMPATRRARSPPPTLAHYDDDSDSESEEEYEEEYYDEDFEDNSLALTRTSSRRHEEQLPELVNDSDESDDESSPPNSPAPFTHSLVRDFADSLATRKAGSIQGPVISDERHTPLVTAY